MRTFVLNNITKIYYIYMFFELASAIKLLTINDYTFFFSLHILLFLLFFLSVILAKNLKDYLIFDGFLANTIAFISSFEAEGIIKIIIAPIIIFLASLLLYRKYKEEKINFAVDFRLFML